MKHKGPRVVFLENVNLMRGHSGSIGYLEELESEGDKVLNFTV